MDFDQASAVIDRLNEVFSGKSYDVPTAAELYSAISVFDEVIEVNNAIDNDRPEGIKANEMVVNKETVKVASALRDHADNVIKVSKEKQKLEKLLQLKLPVSNSRLRLKL